jgi:hypothetical protein
MDALLSTKVPAGVVIIGSSRPRTYFYDVAQMAGCNVSSAHKAHGHLFFNTPRGVNLTFVWHDVARDFNPNVGGFGKMPVKPIKVQAEVASIIDQLGLCDSAANQLKPAAIVYTAGAGIVSRAFAPNELLNGAEYVHNMIQYLKGRCHGTATAIFVTPEMALRNEGYTHDANAFTNNRIVGFNQLVEEVVHNLNVSWVDLYSPSNAQTQGGYTKDIAHYFSMTMPFTGDETSRHAGHQIISAIVGS